MKIIRILLLFLSIIAPTLMLADDVYPTINPKAIFITEEGEEESTSYTGSAPLEAHFYANPEYTEGWTEYYEWRFTGDGTQQPYLIRYEQDPNYTFKSAGSTRIVCYAIFTQGRDSICYTQDYWAEQEPIIVSISESSLEMPNAFSPNGDGINDIYKAKQGYKSLVEFHAAIYNRWGQKLFEWDNPAEGWDGTYNGKDVAQGVYFCRVRALGADGIKYNFKRDVNLLRGYNEDRSTNAE